MAMMTMIARTIDGLPLVGTMQENEEVSKPLKIAQFLKSTTCRNNFCSQAKVYWNIRIKQKCCLES